MPGREPSEEARPAPLPTSCTAWRSTSGRAEPTASNTPRCKTRRRLVNPGSAGPEVLCSPDYERTNPQWVR